MKKIVALILAICVCISMVGCSAITTTHAAESEKVVEEKKEETLGDFATQILAHILAAWISSEISDYMDSVNEQDTETEENVVVEDEEYLDINTQVVPAK